MLRPLTTPSILSPHTGLKTYARWFSAEANDKSCGAADLVFPSTLASGTSPFHSDMQGKGFQNE